MKNYLLFVRHNWPLLGFGFTCVFCGNFGQSFFLGAYGAALKNELYLSSQAYGSLYSAATLCSAGMLFGFGVLIDRWPIRKFFLFVIAGLIAASLAMSSVQNAWHLFAALLLVRMFGQGLFPHTGNTTMARYFDENRGKALSLSTSAVPVGEIVLPLMLLFVMSHYGWRASWWIIAASLPIIVLPTCFYLLKKTGAQIKSNFSKSKNSIGDGRKLLFFDRRFWFAVPTLWASPFFLTAIFIHQDFLLSEKQWSVEWMASCFVFYGFVHWFAMLYAGILVDRFGAVKLLRFYSLPLVFALFAIANLEGDWVLPLVMILLGFCAGAAGPVIGSLWAEVYGTENIGGVRSAAGTTFVLSTSISPIVFGWLIDIDVSLKLIFNISALVLLVGLVLLRFSYRLAQMPALK